MFEINLSKDSDYCTQINNRLIPYESCNTTAAIMALDAARIDYPRRDGIQPEDDLTALLLTDEAWHRFDNVYPWGRKNGLKPQNISPMLAWGINKFVGKQVDAFVKSATLQHMIWHLLNGRPLIMSGSFTKSGHFVAVMGFRTRQHREYIMSATGVDLCRIEYIIVDDPYGNYHTGYKDHRGNNVQFNLQDFNRLTNESNRDGHKWMHIISEAEDDGE
jgi:hypothetical protein